MYMHTQRGMFFMQSPNIDFYALKILGRIKQIQNNALSEDFWYPRISNNYDPKGGVTCHTGQLATPIISYNNVAQKIEHHCEF